MPEHRGGKWTAGIAVAIALLSLYTVAYYGTADRVNSGGYVRYAMPRNPLSPIEPRPQAFKSTWRIQSDAVVEERLERFFRPIHAIDRQVRRGYWESPD